MVITMAILMMTIDGDDDGSTPSAVYSLPGAGRPPTTATHSERCAKGCTYSTSTELLPQYYAGKAGGGVPTACPALCR